MKRCNTITRHAHCSRFTKLLREKSKPYRVIHVALDGSVQIHVHSTHDPDGSGLEQRTKFLSNYVIKRFLELLTARCEETHLVPDIEKWPTCLVEMLQGKVALGILRTFAFHKYEERSRRLSESDTFTMTGTCPEHSDEEWCLSGGGQGRGCTWSNTLAAEITRFCGSTPGKARRSFCLFRIDIFVGVSHVHGSFVFHPEIFVFFVFQFRICRVSEPSLTRPLAHC